MKITDTLFTSVLTYAKNIKIFTDKLYDVDYKGVNMLLTPKTHFVMDKTVSKPLLF